MYLVKTPRIVRSCMPGFLWKMPESEPVIYLTFDDGPIPELTPWVLDTLRPYQAKATFFCVGDNIRKHPQIFQQLLREGHSVGNHTFNHLNGWKNDPVTYLNNTRRCAKLVKSPLFRPPYGKMRPSQKNILERHYRIVMWDVLSADFDQKITPDQCLRNVIENAGPGSIVVFHDNIKAEQNLRHALPATLDFFSKKGFRFEPLPQR